MKIIIVDTETGGLDPAEHSLLSIAACTFPFDAELTFACDVGESVLHVTPAALAINAIDLRKHAATALPPARAWGQLLAFVGSVPGAMRVASRVVLGGHNVAFDVGFLRRLHRLAEDSVPFESYFSHRTIDTMSGGAFLMLAGHLPKGQSMSLAALTTALGITNGEAHTAASDAKATAQLLEAQIAKIQ